MDKEKLINDLKKLVKKGTTGNVAMGYDVIGDDMVSDLCIGFEKINGPTARNELEDDLYESGIEIVKKAHSIWIISKSVKTYKIIRNIIPKATYNIKNH